MKKLALLLITLLTAMPAFAAGSSTRLGDVRVSFPEAPRKTVTRENSPLGPVTVDLYQLKRTGYALSATEARIPAMAVSFLGTRGIYERAAQEYVKQYPGANELKYREIRLLGRPAAELSFRTAQGEIARARILMSAGRVVTVGATWQPGAQAAADRFLGSLQ